MCFDFPYNFVWHIYNSKKNWTRIEWDIIKNVHWFICKSARYSCQISMNPEFSRQIFEKYSVVKFHDPPPPSGSLLFRAYWMKDGQTDR